jgi:hypothetical protein
MRELVPDEEDGGLKGRIAPTSAIAVGVIIIARLGVLR